MLDIGGARYDVVDPNGAAVGRLEHLFKQSLLRSTWRIVGADDAEIAVARERSQALAIARRVVDFLPYGDWVPIPYDFVLAEGERELGHFKRKFLSMRDRYVLDLSGDPERRLDRRLGLALGIGLDALQNR